MFEAPGWPFFAVFAAVAAMLVAISCGGGEPTADRGEEAAAHYRSSLEDDARTLSEWIVRLTTEVERNRKPEAESRFASSRVPLGHLRPLMFAFPELAVHLDALAGTVPPGQLSGFPKVEELVWSKGPVIAGREAARHLLLGVRKLQEKVRTADLEAQLTAGRINEVMSIFVTKALVGEVDPHSHLELVDIAATIEGVEAAFQSLEPLMTADRPALSKRVRAGFDSVYAKIRDFGTAAREPHQPRASSPGTSFVSYTDAAHADVEDLRERVDVLNAALSEVPQALMEAQGGG